MTAISARGLDVVRGANHVLRGIDLDVAEGEWVGIIGPNGAGKSTLLHALSGGLAYSGSISVDGSDLAAMRNRSRARMFATVPQDPVVPHGMLVVDYVLLGRTPHLGLFEQEGSGDVAVAREAMAALELVDIAARPLETLSGGQLQRVVLARALAQAAPVLLLDEPTSALDVGHRVQVLEEIETLRRERSLTVVSALHDLTLAAQFCDRLVLLASGVVAGSGPARTVLTEDAIRAHYGADVTVLDGPDGTVVVIPLRRHHAGVRDEEAVR
jgi:cobalamin transport system ATP-binding protein